MIKIKLVTSSLLLFALLSFWVAVNLYVDNRPQEPRLLYISKYYKPEDFIVPLPDEVERPTPVILEDTLGYKIKHALDGVEVHYQTTRLEYKGRYFITAYCNCSKCCTYANQPTASGVYPHYADYEHRYDEPTTCAIDRKIHSFGTTFYLKSMDRVYIGEDTGNGVKGKHLDLYFTDHASVEAFGSHYEDVYDLIIEEHSFVIDYDLTHPPAEHPKYPYWQRKLHYELFGYDLEQRGFGKREEFRKTNK